MLWLEHHWAGLLCSLGQLQMLTKCCACVVTPFQRLYWAHKRKALKWFFSQLCLRRSQSWAKLHTSVFVIFHTLICITEFHPAMTYVYQTGNHYSFRSSWAMLARDKWWLKTATSATFNTDLVLRLFRNLCFLFDKFIYLHVHKYSDVFMYIFRFQSIILLLNSELGHFKYSIIFLLLYYAYSHNIWMPSNNNCIHVLFSTWEGQKRM